MSQQNTLSSLPSFYLMWKNATTQKYHVTILISELKVEVRNNKISFFKSSKDKKHSPALWWIKSVRVERCLVIPHYCLPFHDQWIYGVQCLSVGGIFDGQPLRATNGVCSTLGQCSVTQSWHMMRWVLVLAEVSWLLRTYLMSQQGHLMVWMVCAVCNNMKKPNM